MSSGSEGAAFTENLASKRHEKKETRSVCGEIIRFLSLFFFSYVIHFPPVVCVDWASTDGGGGVVALLWVSVRWRVKGWVGVGGSFLRVKWSLARG